MSDSALDTASAFRDDNDYVVNNHQDADSQHSGGVSPVAESGSRISLAMTSTDVFEQDASAATFKEAVLLNGICDSGENSGRSEPMRTSPTADGAGARNSEVSACPDVFRLDDKGSCPSVTTKNTFEHCQESSRLSDDSLHVGVPAANGTSELSSINDASSSAMEINPHEPRDDPAGIAVTLEQTLANNFSESSAAAAFVSPATVLPPASETSATQVCAPADGSGDAAHSLPGDSIKPQEQQLPTLVSSTHSTCAELLESSVGQTAPATAENEDMDILGNGKLIKKVLKAGKGPHTRPQYGSQVSIRCQGVLPDGTVVDKSEELSFILHDGDVIAALDLAVALMQLGEECELRAAPDYAYKGIGRHPDVPSDTPITYTVELLNVSEPPVISELPIEQVISLADRKRDRGNYLYSRTEYDNAIICYSRAVQISDDPGIQSDDACKLQELLELRLKCYNNLAATQVKAKQYDAAVESCDKVLGIQPDNVKALFRKGKSLGATGSTKNAIEILKRALQLEPSTKVIHRELSKLQEKLRKDAENEKVLYQKMLGQKSPTADLAKGNQHRSIVTTYGLIGAAAAVALSIGVFMLRKYL